MGGTICTSRTKVGDFDDDDDDDDFDDDDDDGKTNYFLKSKMGGTICISCTKFCRLECKIGKILCSWKGSIRCEN